MERPTCKTCPYWEDQWQEDGGNPEDIGEFGACHRHAPQAVLYVPEDDDDDEKYTMWATTKGIQWCGEHPDFPAYIASLKPSDASRNTFDDQDQAECGRTVSIDLLHRASLAHELDEAKDSENRPAN